MSRTGEYGNGQARRRTALGPIGRAGAALAAAATLVLVAAAHAPAQQQDREDTRERGRSCYCVSSGMPWGAWTVSLGGRALMGVRLATGANAEDTALGARIERVYEDSPAEEAGLRAGDIITAIDGRSVLEPLPDEDIDDDESAPAARVSMILRDVEPGDTIRVEYLRGGERHTAEVVTRDAFDLRFPGLEGELTRAYDRMRELRGALPHRIESFTFAWGAEDRFGIRVADLGPELGQYFGTAEGVLVLEVEEDSPLELRAGDVIQRVGGRRVEDAAHLRQILGTYREGEPVHLDVLRQRQRVTVEGRAP